MSCRNKRNRLVTFLMFTLSLLLASNLMAQDKSAFSTEKVFEGTVVSSIKSTMKWGFNDHYRGMVTYVAKEGTFFHGPIYDAQGKIIKKGTLLMKMDSSYWDRTVKTAQKQLVIAKEELSYRTKDYERQKKLAESHTVSIKEYQRARTEYLKALALVQEEQNDFENADIIRDLCIYRAQYCGVVDKVLLAAGLESGEQPVIEISQLAPIRINVKMDRKLAAKINKEVPIKIYPIDDDKHPVGVFHANSILTDDGISFLTDNYIEPPPVNLNVNGRKIPIVDNWIPIINIYEKGGIKSTKSPLIVPVVSIQKDSNGKYVWKLTGAKDLTAGKGMKYIYPVKKVYIKTGNRKINSASYIKEISIEKNKDLQGGDVILTTDIPKNIKDSDKVCLYRGRYQFMPGDLVKVVVGPLEK